MGTKVTTIPGTDGKPTQHLVSKTEVEGVDRESPRFSITYKVDLGNFSNVSLTVSESGTNAEEIAESMMKDLKVLVQDFLKVKAEVANTARS